MGLVDIEFAKEMTGIEDDTTMEFYIDAVVKKIERAIGYSLSQATQKDFIEGNNTMYLWLLRKPLVEVTEVIVDEKVLVVDDDYTIRNKSFTPHIILNDTYVHTGVEAEITSTAGYTDYDGILPLDEDILAFILATIKNFEGSIDNGGLESYKIDTINYKFLSWIDQQSSFNSVVKEIFGIWS